jgi:hypothetical protein
MASKELARLLSGRNEPSVLEKEALFARVFRNTSPSARSTWRAWGLSFGLITSVAGGMTAAIMLRRPAESTSLATEFESRGGGGQAPSVRLACVDETKEVPCALGRTLTFQVAQIPATSRYFASFSRRSDGVVLWYFPTPEGRSEPIDAAQPILSQAVRLGAPHTTGDYDVYAIFTTLPRTRAEIKEALGADLTSKNGMLVIKRHMTLRDGT